MRKKETTDFYFESIIMAGSAVVGMGILVIEAG